MNTCHVRCGELLAMLAGIGPAPAAGIAEQNPAPTDVKGDP